MATISQEKRPNEVVQLSADFINTLLTGEAIDDGEVEIIITDTLTDEVVTSDILVSGSTEVDGTVVSFRVQGGTDGDCFTVLISTGETTGGNLYETTANLVITTFPATENPLTTRDEVKRQLKITDSSDDRLLDDLIMAASAYIRNRTNKNFHIETYTDTINIPCGEDLIKVKLYNYPLLKVDSISFYDERDDIVDTITDPSYFDFVTEGYVWFTNEFSFYYEPYKNKVTYKAGYKKIPEDVRQACKDLVISFYRAVGREGLSSEKIGDYAYTKALISSWPDSMRREIDVPYVEGVIRRYTRHDFDDYVTY
jgi:hypothetical protein